MGVITSQISLRQEGGNKFHDLRLPVGQTRQSDDIGERGREVEETVVIEDLQSEKEDRETENLERRRRKVIEMMMKTNKDENEENESKKKEIKS